LCTLGAHFTSDFNSACSHTFHSLTGVTNTDIAEIVLAALERPCMAKAAIGSAKRRGVWPLDSSVIDFWLAKEQSTMSEHPVVKAATQLVLQTLETAEKKKAEHKAKKQQEKIAKKLKPQETDIARELTDVEQLVRRRQTEQLSEVKRVTNVEELREKLKKPIFSFTDEDLQDASGRWKPRKAFIALAEAFIEDQRKTTEQHIKKLLAIPGPVPEPAPDAAAPEAPRPTAQSVFESFRRRALENIGIDILQCTTEEELEIVFAAITSNTASVLSSLEHLQIVTCWRSRTHATPKKTSPKKKADETTTPPPPPLQTLPSEPDKLPAASKRSAAETFSEMVELGAKMAKRTSSAKDKHFLRSSL